MLGYFFLCCFGAIFTTTLVSFIVGHVICEPDPIGLTFFGFYFPVSAFYYEGWIFAPHKSWAIALIIVGAIWGIATICAIRQDLLSKCSYSQPTA